MNFTNYIYIDFFKNRHNYKGRELNLGLAGGHKLHMDHIIIGAKPQVYWVSAGGRKLYWVLAEGTQLYCAWAGGPYLYMDFQKNQMPIQLRSFAPTLMIIMMMIYVMHDDDDDDDDTK